MEIEALVPAYNEARRIGSTVAAIFKIEQIRRVLVVDDGSTDQTAAEAAAAGAQVLRLHRNRGKGGAVLRGLSLLKAPYVALVDADLGGSAGELSCLLPPLQSGGAAMSIAIFPEKRGGGLGLVKGLAAWAIRRCAGQVMKEPLSGQRILRRELLQALSPAPRGFGLEIALTLDFLQQGGRVVEVPARLAHRERGRDLRSWLHRGRQGKDIMRELWLRRGRLFGRGGEG